MTSVFRGAGPRPVAAMSLAAALMLLAIGACDGSLDVDAPPPAMSADIDTLPALPTSTLDIPLTYDLSPVVEALERAVPKTFGDIDDRRQLSNKRMRVAFEAIREPFKVSLDGQTANLTAVINYQGKGWYDAPLAPEVSGSCGIDQPKPRARIQIATALRITPEWKLRGRTRVGDVTPFSDTRRDQCRVTVFNIDVTGRVIEAARNAVIGKRSLIDQKIAALDIRPRFQEWWHLLQRPIPLTDSVWLQINPSAVRMGESVGTRRTLVTALGFSASPRIVTGSRPAPLETPLPPLYPAAVGDGLHILLDGVIGYDIASRLLEDKLKGKKIDRAGQTLEVSHVRLFGIGGGKLALELRFKGAAQGRIYFVGTPRYDASTNELFVPDLDYDVGSVNALVSGLEWVKHNDVREFFRQRARWSVGSVMQKGREQLAKGLNRDLAPGVRLTADVKAVHGLAVNAQRSAILLRAQADATAKLTVKKGG
ncbi:MAG: DUF4403 family protein [Gemmatimonadaceae bacterium]